jgi:hypothetical protein
MPDFDVYEYLKDTNKFDRVRSHIKAVAVKKGFKYGHDDPRALADDLEIAGWVGFLEGNGSLLYTYRAMNQAWCKWRFNQSYKGNETNWNLPTTSLNVTIKSDESENQEYIEFLVDSTFNTEEEAFHKEIYRKLKESFEEKAKFTDRKATPLQVKQIKDLAKDGISQRQIAARFKLSRSIIQHILDGSSYVSTTNTTRQRANQMGLMLDTMIKNGEPIFTKNDLKNLKISKDNIQSKINEIRETYKKVVGE